MSVEMVNWNG